MRPDKPRVLADFEGDWQLQRRIVQRGGPPMRFVGEARWRAAPEGMEYLEAGVLEVQGQPAMQAERHYLWKDDLTVWFPSGRFFHLVPRLGGGAIHHCTPDLYRVRYRFGAWPAFETLWRVTGPRKDYAMISRYRRDLPQDIGS